MKIVRNLKLTGKHEKPILTDLFYLENGRPKKIIIFCHGYKGYKDWGAWNLVAEQFARKDIFFVKMNFSHNGGTPEQPIDFPDLEAFGNNNFIKELDDLDTVVNWIISNEKIQADILATDISLIGHSRGGGITVLKAATDRRISKVISWAGVSDFGCRFPSGEPLEIWKKNGVAYITNSRTNQQMPHYIQFYKSFKENETILNIENAVKKLSIPYLILHGSNDETVSLKEAENLYSWNSNNRLEVLTGANHTFGCSQPWEDSTMPKDLSKVVSKSIQFLNN